MDCTYFYNFMQIYIIKQDKFSKWKKKIIINNHEYFMKLIHTLLIQKRKS